MPRWPLTAEQRLASYAMLDGDCLIFTGSKAGNGYGVMYFNGRQQYAHRIAWQLYNGDIPEGNCVLHKCDNPACINLSHLFLGTKRDNTHDMMNKGRAGFYKGKITFEQHRGIILQLKKNVLSYNAIARLFGVSAASVRRIDTGERVMPLYNIRTTELGYRITKFDSDLNVLSSYTTTAATCECPQGIKPTCRHRKMLPLMVDRADSAWFYNYDQGVWKDPTGQAGLEQQLDEEAAADREFRPLLSEVELPVSSPALASEAPMREQEQPVPAPPITIVEWNKPFEGDAILDLGKAPAPTFKRRF